MRACYQQRGSPVASPQSLMRMNAYLLRDEQCLASLVVGIPDWGFSQWKEESWISSTPKLFPLQMLLQRKGCRVWQLATLFGCSGTLTETARRGRDRNAVWCMSLSTQSLLRVTSAATLGFQWAPCFEGRCRLGAYVDALELCRYCKHTK